MKKLLTLLILATPVYAQKVDLASADFSHIRAVMQTNVSGGSASFTNLTPGTNTQTGTFTWSRTGVFTNAQQNENLSMILNSCSASTEYNTLHSGAGFATDGVMGCIAQPSGTTAIQSNAVAGYITTNQNSSSGTVADAVALYGQCRNLVTGGGCWGLNAVATDGWPNVGVAAFQTAAEFDNFVANASTVGFGIQIGANFTAQPTQSTSTDGNYPAAIITPGGTGQFTAGFSCRAGATENGTTHGDCLDISATASSGTVSSQSIMFHDLIAGSIQSLYMLTTPTPAGPQLLVVPTSSSNGNSIAVLPPHALTSGMSPNNFISGGTCVFSSSTTCSYTFSNAYFAAPICTITEVGTTPGSIIQAEVTSNTTTVTITAASSNSATWNWICVPTAN